MYCGVCSGTPLLFVYTAFYHVKKNKQKKTLHLTQYGLTGSKSPAELLKSIT